MAKVPPPKVPPGKQSGAQQQPQGGDPAEDDRADKFNTQIPEGEMSRHFVFDGEDGQAAPSKDSEEDLGRFKAFVAAVSADQDLPDGARGLVDSRDLDSLWALFAHALSSR